MSSLTPARQRQTTSPTASPSRRQAAFRIRLSLATSRSTKVRRLVLVSRSRKPTTMLRTTVSTVCTSKQLAGVRPMTQRTSSCTTSICLKSSRLRPSRSTNPTRPWISSMVVLSERSGPKSHPLRVAFCVPSWYAILDEVQRLRHRGGDHDSALAIHNEYRAVLQHRKREIFLRSACDRWTSRVECISAFYGEGHYRMERAVASLCSRFGSRCPLCVSV